MVHGDWSRSIPKLAALTDHKSLLILFGAYLHVLVFLLFYFSLVSVLILN